MNDERGPIVTVEWLYRHIDTSPNVRIVDARPFDAYRAVHIPGAANSDQNLLKLADSRPESIARFQQEIAKEIRRLGIRPDHRVVFYDDISGVSAARGVWLLDYAGLDGSAMLDGGLRAWHAAGGRLTRDIPVIVPSTTRIRPIDDLLATADEISTALASGKSMRVLDTRNVLEYRNGTIPTSTHIEWIEHLAPDGSFLPLDELRTRYQDAGLETGRPEQIVTFCGSGYRAAHTYVVLKALGFPSVSNYAPSWGEWGRRPDLPTDRPRLSAYNGGR